MVIIPPHSCTAFFLHLSLSLSFFFLSDFEFLFLIHGVQIGRPVITEDTALCFAAMNGLPGPYIKFFLRELGHEGTLPSDKNPGAQNTHFNYSAFPSHVTDDDPRTYPPGLNRMLDGFSTRAAWALCTFAYSAGPGTEPVLFEGRTDGKIVPARGPAKFGWDPVFEAEDTGLTYVFFFFGFFNLFISFHRYGGY